jgi:hypothetical protein
MLEFLFDNIYVVFVDRPTVLLHFLSARTNHVFMFQKFYNHYIIELW